MKWLVLLSLMLISACAPVKPDMDKQAVEAEMARCGLVFQNPKWKITRDRRPSLSLYVPQLDSVPDAVMECVTNVAIKYDVAAALNTADGSPQ